MIFSPDGIIPDSGLTGLNNTYTHTYIYIYIYKLFEMYLFICNTALVCIHPNLDNLLSRLV